MKKLLMEFIGTFFFILTIALSLSPWAVATMLMAWLYIGVYVSGGHYNPAVSFAMALRGRFEWAECWAYMLAQCVGGFCAYAMASFLNGQMHVPEMGASMTHGFIIETLLTFIFASVVLNVITGEKFRGSHIFGFAIGFTFPALVALGGPISGGLFNPAIAIGSMIFGAFKGMNIMWPHLMVFVVSQLLGAFLAATAFRYFVLDREK